MKLVQAFTVTEVTAKVYRDVENDCYLVRLFSEGKENEAASYESDDKADALGTAQDMLRRQWSANRE